MTRRAILEISLKLLDDRRRELQGELSRILEAVALAKSEFAIGDVVECRHGHNRLRYSGRRESKETWRRYKVVDIKRSRVHHNGVTLFGRQYLKNGRLSEAITDLEWKNPRKVADEEIKNPE